MTKNQKITIGAVLVVSAGALIYSLATYKGHSAPKVEETASGPTINDLVIGEQTAPTPVAGTTGAPVTATPTGTTTPGQGVPPSASATNTLAGTTGTPGTPGTPATPGLTVTPTAGPVAPAVTNEPPVAVVTSYTVKKGDTLHGIAKAELGSDAKWKDILAANPNLDPKKLKIGMKLQMPSKAGTSTVASAGTTSTIAPGGTTALNGSTPGTTTTTGNTGFTPVSSPAAPATGATKAKPVATAPKTSGTTTKVSTGKVSTRDGVSIYTVRDGDTLRSISKDVYRGDEAKWESVFRLNRDVIGSDPGRLEAGTILILPASGK